MQIITASGKAPVNAAERNRPVFPSGQMVLFGLVTAVFFLWGMSNNLTDILVQQFRKSFELNLIEAQLVQTSVFLAYGTMAIPAALLMRRFGYKAGLITGLCLFAGGTLLFWPAAVIGQYAPFLVALFAVGCGSSILETAANPFIAQFGDPATSERRLNFAQAFNPPGSITGVFLGTYFIFSGVEKSAGEVSAMKAAGTYAGYLHTEIMRVVPTYVGLGAVVLVLAFAIGRMRFPAMLDAGAEDGPQGSFAGFAAVSAFAVRGSGTVLLCGRAGGDVEHVYPVPEGVYVDDGTACGRDAGGDAGGAGGGANLLYAADAVCVAGADDGRVCVDQYGPDFAGDCASGRGGRVCDSGELVLYVDYVSDDLCAGGEGAGGGYEAGREPDRDVGGGRGGDAAADGRGDGAYREPGGGVLAAVCGVRGGGGVWAVWVAARGECDGDADDAGGAVRIDAHHHLWRYSEEEFGWLEGPLARPATGFFGGGICRGDAGGGGGWGRGGAGSADDGRDGVAAEGGG